MLREMYRTIIAYKNMIDIFFSTKKIPQLIGVCILKVVFHLKENVQCVSKGKTNKDPVISLLCDKKFLSNH